MECVVMEIKNLKFRVTPADGRCHDDPEVITEAKRVLDVARMAWLDGETIRPPHTGKSKRKLDEDW
jgi:hypothetical protein